MRPILFAAGETTFQGQGLGTLSDATACKVTEERNGKFELVMDYPESGLHFEGLAVDAIILAKPNEVSGVQPFRVYRITKPIGGIATIYAEHISYRLARIVTAPFSATSAAMAMAGFAANAAGENPFTFWTDKTTLGLFQAQMPQAIRALLGGQEGSVLDVYGGEFEFDGYTVKLHDQRGQNAGVTLRYGKNITDLKQDENIASVITGVYPFWRKGNDDSAVYFELPEKIVTIASGFSYARVAPLDCSGEFEEMPTADQLRTSAQAYLSRPGVGVPRVSIEVSFIQLWQTAGNEEMAALERVALCDTVTIAFEKLGINATAKVIKTVYDCLRERFESVEIGEAKSTLEGAILEQREEIKQIVAEMDFDITADVEAATNQIVNGMNGYVSFTRNAEGKIFEILIMDTEEKETAVNVWRWNSGGLGFSSTGYGGPYGTAITADGRIVADFITTGQLNAANVNVVNINASNITSGTISAQLLAIGQWLINDGGLFYGTPSNPTHYLGATGINATVAGRALSNVIFKAGSGFGVTAAGAMYCNAGLVGGFGITASTLSTNPAGVAPITLDAGNGFIQVGDLKLFTGNYPEVQAQNGKTLILAGGSGISLSGNGNTNDLTIDSSGRVYIGGVQVPKIQSGSANVNTSSGTYISLSGFSSTPYIVATYSQASGNTSGDFGSIKIYSKSSGGFYAIIGGSTPSGSVQIDWIAIGS
jgi:phage minor structural protein